MKLSKKEHKQDGTNRSSSSTDPRTAHKEDQITNTDEQDEIVNEPNYKTDREEEVQGSDQPTNQPKEQIKKESSGAEAQPT